ncbi:MAG: hypothetical protein Q8P24_04730 [Desulfobacterales bacterium]|nr:hypothetical protein [Desulfobacterales bacterium]
MDKLKLSIACRPYDHVRPLMDKTVRPEGMDLSFICLEPHETFTRQIRDREFDISEMSLSYYTYLHSQGNENFLAIPIFPARTFRHSCIYIHTGSGIRKPEDLRGASIGVPGYYMTAAVWLRGLLQHEFGVKPEDMKWYYSRKDIFDWDPPGKLDYHKIPEDQNLDDLLQSGKIQALMNVRKPVPFRKGAVTVARLFPDYQQAEKDYYAKTGIFPIMHTLVVKREIHEKHPWVAPALYRAFVASREFLASELDESGTMEYSLAWFLPALEEERKLLGKNFWDYGLKNNRKAVETLIQYSHEQGLASRIMPAEELFIAETLGLD